MFRHFPLDFSLLFHQLKSTKFKFCLPHQKSRSTKCKSQAKFHPNWNSLLFFNQPCCDSHSKCFENTFEYFDTVEHIFWIVFCHVCVNRQFQLDAMQISRNINSNWQQFVYAWSVSMAMTTKLVVASMKIYSTSCWKVTGLFSKKAGKAFSQVSLLINFLSYLKKLWIVLGNLKTETWTCIDSLNCHVESVLECVQNNRRRLNEYHQATEWQKHFDWRWKAFLWMKKYEKLLKFSPPLAKVVY